MIEKYPNVKDPFNINAIVYINIYINKSKSHTRNNSRAYVRQNLLGKIIGSFMVSNLIILDYLSLKKKRKEKMASPLPIMKAPSASTKACCCC